MQKSKLDQFFSIPAAAVLMAVVCNVLWGSAFPFIKLGYRLFAIDSADTASILCFAGVRFMIGAALVGLALNRRPLPMPRGKTLASACGLGLWQTAAQYFFYYSAVALLTGAMGGILNSTQSFMGVILAHFLYGKADRMTPRKALGCALGFALGTWIFPLFIWMGYSMLYDFAPIVYVFDGWLLIISVLAALACSAGVTWLSCHAELRENPANLMRPKAPKAGKRILLEYIPFVWNRLSFLHKVSIRNIVRYKKRLFMMLLGVGGCTALIVAGLGLRDSISTVVDDQFRGVTHYQIAVTFVSPMDEAQQQAFREKYADEMTQCIFVHAAAYEARTSGGINKVNVIATDDPAITQAIDLHEDGRTVAWPQQGVLLDAALARDTGVSVGETLPVSVDDTTSVDLPVAGTFENYVYHYAYMTAETYKDLFGADCEYSTAYILTDGDAYALGAALASNSRVASVTVSEALQDIVDNTMKSLDYIVGLVVVCACALALVVLFNLCNISITERVREIATVKVLGFYHRETLNYVFREILLLTFCGALVGLPAGWALHRFIMQNIRISLVSFHIHVTPLSYALAFAATLLLAVAVCLCLIRKIDRISMAESLKSIE